MNKTERFNLDYFPVVCSNSDEKLIGILDRKAVIRLLNAKVLERQGNGTQTIDRIAS